MVRLTDVEDAVPAIALLCSQTVIYWSVQLIQSSSTSNQEMSLRSGLMRIRLKQVKQGEVEEAAWHLEDKAQLSLGNCQLLTLVHFALNWFGTVSKSAWTGGWLFSQAIINIKHLLNGEWRLSVNWQFCFSCRSPSFANVGYQALWEITCISWD